MFKDSEFDAGNEFTNKFISSIYSKLYLPENTIMTYGEQFEDIIMIQQCTVNIFTKCKLKDGEEEELQCFVLPTFSYFGDY